MLERQTHLFYAWNNALDRLKLMRCYIQNDFKEMLSDGLTTKKDITLSREEFENKYLESIKNLDEIKKQITLLMIEHE